MSLPKISIIVPIHNAGIRLEKCLNTLVNQTLKEIEIILILDCPTDGSDKISQQYSKNDERIKIINNKENLHTGLSRNEGLKGAKGEYIGFSDHDDYRELDMYEKMYDHAKKNDSDIIICTPALIRNDKIEIWDLPQKPNSHCRDFALSDLIGSGNYTRDVSLFCNIHNIIYKTELIKKNNIRFVDTNSIAPEDVLFNISCIYHAQSVDFLHVPLYYHILYLESEGHNYNYGSWQKRGEGMLVLYNFLKSTDSFEQYQVQFYIQVTKQFLNSLLATLVQNKSLSEFIRAFIRLKKYPFTKDAFNHYSIFSKNRGRIKRSLRNIIAFCFK